MKKTVFLLLGLFLLCGASSASALVVTYPSYAEMTIYELDGSEGLRVGWPGETTVGTSAYVYNSSGATDNDSDEVSTDSFEELSSSSYVEGDYAIAAGEAYFSEGIYLGEIVGAAADETITTAYAEASAWFEFEATVIGSGVVTIEGSYDYYQLIDSENTGEYGEAYSEIGLHAELDGVLLDEMIFDFLNSASDGESGEWGTGESEYFTFSFEVDSDEEATLLVGGYVYNEALATTARVPEPSTMLLLGIGLVGLAGVSRKKFKK